MTQVFSAYDITSGLGGKVVGRNKFIARCPAHDDSNPSLSITQAEDKVLVHCHAGCSQEELVHALQSRGLWHKEKFRRKHRLESTRLCQNNIDYMASYILIYKKEVHGGYQATPEEIYQYKYFRLQLEHFGSP